MNTCSKFQNSNSTERPVVFCENSIENLPTERLSLENELPIGTFWKCCQYFKKDLNVINGYY